MKKPVPDLNEDRPTRTKKLPNRFLNALFLLTFITITAAEPPLSDGIYFQPELPVIFSDSEWIISTDIKFTEIQDNLAYLGQKIIDFDVELYLAPITRILAPTTKKQANVTGTVGYLTEDTLKFLRRHFNEQSKG